MHIYYTAVTAELSKPFGNIHRKCEQVGTSVVHKTYQYIRLNVENH